MSHMDDLLNTDNDYFEQINVNIYPKELYC